MRYQWSRRGSDLGALLVVALGGGSCSDPGAAVPVQAPLARPADPNPAAVRMAALRAVQRDAGPEFALINKGAALVAANLPQAFQVRFEERGPTLKGDGGAWQLRLVGPGAPAPAQVVEGRATYRRGDGIEEWYANGPLGLEHGFALAKRPADARPGALEVEVEVAGGLRPELESNGARVLLRKADGRVALYYGGLYAEDARGRELPSRLAVAAGRIQLHVDDREAMYPIAIDPLIYTQQGKLTASDGAADDDFGISVAVSADGNTAIAGAPHAAGTTALGAAYVYVRAAGVWSEQAKLVGADTAADDEFGASVSLSGDGNTAIVGAPQHDTTPTTNQGAAYVFVRSGTSWTQDAQLLAADAAQGDQFGRAVALSGDGTTAIVGAPLDNTVTGGDDGSAYVYLRVSPGVWTPQGLKLAASDAATLDNFGAAVALSADGNTALIGAPHPGGTVATGAAYVFLRTTGVWAQQGKLVGSDSAGDDDFGGAVALSGDGDTALVGAQQADVATVSNVGAAYVFLRASAVWSQQQKLVASDGAAGDRYGAGVALSGNGNVALVGASADNVATATDQGSVYVVQRAGTTWTEQQRLSASDGVASDELGAAVALSANSSTAVAGAPHPGGTTAPGAAWAFALKPNGAPCTAALAGECLSGFCVDAVCCDNPCGGGDDTDCFACSTAKGAFTNGSCGARAFNTVCRPAAVGMACDAVEVCDGSTGSCPTDGVLGSGTVCRPAVTGGCDIADTCNGVSAACPVDAVAPMGTSCRVSAGVCDPAETCTGSSPSCPTDAKQPATFVCNPSLGGCDPAERCDGVNDTCPPNARSSFGVVCRGAGGPCDAAELCDGSSDSCPFDAKLFGTCRPAAGGCDVEEICDGSTNACPSDVKVVAGIQCRGSLGPCDPAEACDGTAPTCPADGRLPAGTPCRITVGPCDAQESCDGIAVSCPADVKKPAGAECRPASGACDVAETCAGGVDTCPADVKKPAGAECRPVSGVCDVSEACDGVSGACPEDGKKTDGTPCVDSVSCNGIEVCTAGQCAAPAPFDCDDHDNCTADSCSEPGTCTHTPIPNCFGAGASGCACDVSGRAPAPPWMAGLLLVGLVLVRRRRAR